MNLYLEPFFRRLWEVSDINQHLPILFTLAQQCQTIVEFGVRSGNSTCAFLAGLSTRPEKTALYSYDIENYIGQILRYDPPTAQRAFWFFSQEDTTKLATIPNCDLLFIDTLHTHNQVVLELRHAPAVSRWIVLHDTELFGIQGERGEPGIRSAIRQFLERNHNWRVLYEYRHNCGLMILEKQ